MPKRIRIFFFLLLLSFPGWLGAADKPLKPGTWRVVLQLNDSTELPFTMEVKKLGFSFLIEIINGEERIAVDEFSIARDSVFMIMPVFDSEFRLKNLGDSLRGYWINHARKEKNIIPVRARLKGGSRFLRGEVPGPATSVTKWETVFSPGTGKSYPALGVFRKKGNYLAGTFLTETGDYRFLEGYDNGKEMKLSGFDGAFAFLFTANYITPDSLSGMFYSGAHFSEPWVAGKNDTFRLADPEKLTYLKPGYETVSFSFYNTEGKKVSLSDHKYKGKVVIVQLLGSWCPNCMDETAFLSALYSQYNGKGLEVIGLAFERGDSINAIKNINRVKTRFGAGYEFLFTGKSNSRGAEEVLPALNHVMAFPTTIFIDRKGKVRRIHTGFSGPGTGEFYDRYVLETTQFVEKMLKERK